MDGLTAVGSILTSVKTAIDITKLIKDSDGHLEKAEVKLQFAELIGALADVKIELVEVQEIIAEKDARIVELEESLKIKAKVIKHHDAYYFLNEDGNPEGDPYCLHCWESEGRLRSLSHITRQNTTCPGCKTTYAANTTYNITYNEEGDIQYSRR